jgi:hypothetical protein
MYGPDERGPCIATKVVSPLRKSETNGKSIADWQYWVSQGHRLQLTHAYRKLTKFTR